MLIAIDAGNTRVKWGVYSGSSWVAQGPLLTAGAVRLAQVSAARPPACSASAEWGMPRINSSSIVTPAFRGEFRYLV